MSKFFRHFILILFNAWILLVVIVATVSLGSLAIMVSAIPPRGNWMIHLARLWSRLLLSASGIRLSVSGAERVPRGSGSILMANHSSYWDIPALFLAIPVQVRFFAKKSLFAIPIFGWALSAGGFIPIDRKNRRNAVKSLDVAAARLAQGSSIVLFPEETRSTSDDLLPFQRGGFLLALKAGLPIVPAGIRGMRGVMAKGDWLVRPGRVAIHFGEPLHATEHKVREKDIFIEKVRESIEKLRGATSGSA